MRTQQTSSPQISYLQKLAEQARNQRIRYTGKKPARSA
jgi:hypothetical protein